MPELLRIFLESLDTEPAQEIYDWLENNGTCSGKLFCKAALEMRDVIDNSRTTDETGAIY